MGLVSGDGALISEMLCSSFKGVCNRIECLDTKVYSIFEASVNRFEGVHKGIKEIQTLIAHMYHVD